MHDLPNPNDVAIVVSGLATIDILTYPAPLTEPIGAGVLRTVERIDVATGGCVSNVASALARLGMPVAALTTIGDDIWGELWQQRLESAGVDCGSVLRQPGGTTSVSNVLVDRDSARSFLFAPGASTDFDLPHYVKSLRNYKQARWLLFGYFSLFPNCDRKLPEWFEGAKKAGLKTALDTAGHGGDMEPLIPILPWLDLYLPSYSEAKQQTGLLEPSGMLDRFRENGARGILGIKLGERGALLSDADGKTIHVRALRPPTAIIDTTGAGDAFFAGLLAGLTRGMPLAEAGQFAAAAAAWSLTALGATAGLQDWDTTWKLAFANPS